jgi:hypothetical protein
MTMLWKAVAPTLLTRWVTDFLEKAVKVTLPRGVRRGGVGSPPSNWANWSASSTSTLI